MWCFWRRSGRLRVCRRWIWVVSVPIAVVEGGWDVRRVDYHGHSILAVLVFGLRAVEIDGVGAVHGDLEYGLLIRY